MYLFIAANTALNIPSSILDTTIIDMVQACSQTQEHKFIIVGDEISEPLRQLTNAQSNVLIKNNRQASDFITQVTNASIIHFGNDVKWASTFPVYFIPLTNELAQNKGWFIKSYFQKRKFNLWLHNSNKIIALQNWASENLKKAYPKLSFKIQETFLPTTVPQKLEWDKLFEIKENIANGNNYFLVFAPLQRFTAILKEFSIFKKWQQTTMNLVFILDTQEQVNQALVLLKGYKFKSDILVYASNQFQKNWLAATYCILWEGVHFSKSGWIFDAIHYDIPLLFDAQIGLPDSWLKAGEFFSFSEKQALSNHFKLYYKDEVYRQESAKQGKAWLTQLNENKGGKELFNKIVLSHII